ncbi:hypothetical protein SDC9_20222 [bioreactor metagenome]|uniref:Uncharacterized protein n=1 Tax=bioreactor metagenome TaxID=1076179 RepID=A0A644U5X9_9ZZZZ
MNTIDFFDSTDDLRAFAPGVDGSLLLESLYPSFLHTKTKIINVISRKVYDAILDIYPTPDSELQKVVFALKTAIANYTMYKYSIFDAVSKNGSEKKLYKYQLEEIKEEYITLFWSSMDELLNYLDERKDFGGWDTTNQFKEREGLVIKDAVEFNSFFGIDYSSYFFTKILFLIKKLNQDEIVPRVGDIASITNQRLKDKCKRALCSHVMADAVMLFDITELPKSIRNDVAHEFTKGGTAVQVREKLNAILMKDVLGYYSDIERAKIISSGVTENVVNNNRESDKIYFMS